MSELFSNVQPQQEAGQHVYNTYMQCICSITKTLNKNNVEKIQWRSCRQINIIENDTKFHNWYKKCD